MGTAIDNRPAYLDDQRPAGIQRGRGGFLRSADDSPYVSDPTGTLVKSGARKGEILRLKYGSPSHAGYQIDPAEGLVKFKQRNSFAGVGMSDELVEWCQALATMEAGSLEFIRLADRIAVEADKLTRSSLAAERGTHGHALTEANDRRESWRHLASAGRALGLDFNMQQAVVDAWQRMLWFNGLEILAIEASCVDDIWRLAGTLDRIVRTTRALRFVQASGEVVEVPAGTVCVLDIKFGKLRKAHPIQIASYAQSVPYDTAAETRGEWPWPIDQTHALIAQGDFGGEGRPVTIELVHVDLVAGREHGGQCVVDAKAWEARTDVFSDTQIVSMKGDEPDATQIVPESADASSALVDSGTCPTCHGDQSVMCLDPGCVEQWCKPCPDCGTQIVPVEEVPVDAVEPGRRPSTGTSVVCPTCNGTQEIERVATPDEVDDGFELGIFFGPCPDCLTQDSLSAACPTGASVTAAGVGASTPAVLSADDFDAPMLVAEPPVLSAVEARPEPRGAPGSPTPAPRDQRLALVDARNQLATNPDQGRDMPNLTHTASWEALERHYNALDNDGRAWLAGLVKEATRRGVPFHARNLRTERVFETYRGLIALAAANANDDELLRALLALVLGDIALIPGIHPGHLCGALSADKATAFAELVDRFNTGELALEVASDGTLHLEPKPAA